jgi:N-formylglutamate amidohydrolase
VNHTNWEIAKGEGPIIATAIHAGHELRPEVRTLAALSDEARLREEDPFTDQWLWIGDTTVNLATSRFEVDLNRPRASAVYREPSDAWGLALWKQPLPPAVIEESLELYDAFYAELERLLDEVAAGYERFVVLDLHSYNHRRRGPDAPVDPPSENPEINVGTGTVDQDAWGDVVAAFSTALAQHPFDGGRLDVRENVRFRGGHMSRWINERYSGRGTALAIEVKKFYMDEWTGRGDEGVIVSVGEALATATTTVRAVLTP